MSNITWRVAPSGHVLEIYSVDPSTRMLTLLQSLKTAKPLSQEQALKYIENNYPKNGSAVTLAADALSQADKKR